MIGKSKNTFDYDVLCIGHLCHDKTAKSVSLGGSASYASILAQSLKQKVHILTSFALDFQYFDVFEGISITNQPSQKTTTFKNSYQGNARSQKVLSIANDLNICSLPTGKITLLCPILHEISYDDIQICKSEKTILALTPQGLLRQWDSEGNISYKALEWNKIKGLDFLILSNEDVPNYKNELPKMLKSAQYVLITKAEKGVSIFSKHQSWEIPAIPTNVVDPTGAGDCFAMGFLLKYSQTKDLIKSAKYGHFCASKCIQQKGVLRL